MHAVLFLLFLIGGAFATMDILPGRVPVVGEHFVGDLQNCDPAILDSPAMVEQIFTRAANLGGASVNKITQRKFDPQGLTILATLSDSSHITLHSWPEHGFGAVDVFMFGHNMDAERALLEIRTSFKCHPSSSTSVVERGGLPPPLNSEIIAKHTTLKATGLRKILDLETPHQVIGVFNHPSYGNALVLDGNVQATQRDSFVLDEMLLLPALLGNNVCGSSPSVSLLLLGGGDGGVLRVALSLPCIKRVTIVEIDEAVIRLSKEHLNIHGDFADPRVSLQIANAESWCRSAVEKRLQFDIVVMDVSGPIPNGPSEHLFLPSFIRQLPHLLTPHGVIATNLDAPFYSTSRYDNSLHHIGVRFAEAFPRVEIFRAAVPSQVGGDIALLVASKDGHSSRRPASPVPTSYTPKYYSPRIHTAAFALPPFWHTLHQGEEAIIRNLDHSRATPHQLTRHQDLSPLGTRYEFLEDWPFGTMLVQNHTVRRTKHDAFFQEFFVHIPLMAQSLPLQELRVLVLGGADGGVVRELLRYKHQIKSIVFVEADEKLVLACQDHLGINGNWKDPRVLWVKASAPTFVESLSSDMFDLVFIDEVLASPALPDWAKLAASLSPRGVLTLMGGSPFLDAQVSLNTLVTALARIFANVEIFLGNVPSLVGGPTAFVAASKLSGSSVSEPLQRLSFPTQFYSPEAHKAAFALPASWLPGLSRSQLTEDSVLD